MVEKDRFQNIGWLIEATEGEDPITQIAELGLTVTIDVNAGTITVTAGGTGDLTTSFYVGGSVNVIGTDDNDEAYEITAVAATILTVTGLVGTNVVGDSGVSLYTTEKYYHFANYTKTWGDFPSLKSTIIPRYRGDSRNPYRLDVTKIESVSQMSVMPTNGLMLYLLYGGAIQHPTGGAGHHQLKMWDELAAPLSNQPSFATRFHTASSTNALRKTVVGNKMLTHSFNVNLATKDAMAGLIAFDGRRMIPVSTNTEFNARPVYADGNSEEDQTWYRRDNNFVFKWDSDLDWAAPTGDNFSAQILTFGAQLDNFNRFMFGSTNKYPSWIIENNRSTTILLTILRGEGTEIFDDYMNQASAIGVADTFKNAHIKIYNTASNFQRFDFTQIAIASIGMNHVSVGNEEQDVYTIAGIARLVDPVVKDGVPSALYGY